jgi:hypothetical protein
MSHFCLEDALNAIAIVVMALAALFAREDLQLADLRPAHEASAPRHEQSTILCIA